MRRVAVPRHAVVNGEPVVHIGVKGAIRYCLRNPRATAFVILDAEDFERIKAQGLTLCWYMNARAAGDRDHAYVRCRVKGKGTRQVAHFVAAPPKGYAVRHRDGNPLNLRRSNLFLTLRGSRTKGDVREIMTTKEVDE